MQNLRFAVIHSLDKERNEIVATTRLKRLLNAKNEKVIELSNQLVELVGKEGGAVSWGQFGADKRQGEFPDGVYLFCDDSSGENFVELSKTAMEELRKESEQERLATGGYVCFFAYDSQGALFILVAMIKERDALQLSDDFVPTGSRQIDLSKLHQAARININRLVESRVGNSNDPSTSSELTYLSFVTRRDKTTLASGYFVSALGCVRGLSVERITARAVTEVTAFIKKIPQIKDQARTARRAVIDHLAQVPEGVNATIKGIVTAVCASLAPENAHFVEGLADHLNSEKIQLPDEFEVSAKAMKAFNRIRSKSELWELSFEDAALGTKDSALVYSKVQKSLTIVNLPPELTQRIEETLRDREAIKAQTNAAK